MKFWQKMNEIYIILFKSCSLLHSLQKTGYILF